MPQRSDFEAFFADYVAAYNRSLGERVDSSAIRSFFSPAFIGAGPDGVQSGVNDESFEEALEKGYAFYKAIGTREMRVTGLGVTEIDPAHHMVKVDYEARYEKAGEPITIPFDVTYMLETRDGRSTIFAFVAGDEMGLYRQYGLLDGTDAPA